MKNLFIIMPKLLITEFCKYFNCEINELKNFLANPINREKLNSRFRGVWLRTTYKNRKNQKHLFRYNGLSIQDAKHTKAYNNFLGVTVLQHFYARHRVYIYHHELPCVIEYTPHSGASYYPLEYLEIVENPCQTEEENAIYLKEKIDIICNHLFEQCIYNHM